MTALVEIGLSNAMAALLLAGIAVLVSLCCRRPAVVHALWLLVLLKLVTPPLIRIPIPVLGHAAPEENLPAVALNIEEPILLELEDEGIVLTPDQEVCLEEVLPGPEDGEEIDIETEEGPATLSEEPMLSQQIPVTPPTVIAGIWATGSLLWFGLAGLRLWRFGRLLRLGRPAPQALSQRVQRLAARLGLTVVPEVRVLPARLAPLVWGWRRPLLVLPQGLEELVGPEGLDTLLLHELAHVRRGDQRVRLLELFALGMYWWFPLTWYVRRELREAEEQCCDAWVVDTLPDAKRLYASALVDALDFLAQPEPVLPPLSSGLGQVADLKRRLTMIMRGTTPHDLSRSAALAVFGLALTLLPFVPSPSYAQQEEKKEAFRVIQREGDLQRLEEEMKRKQEELEQLRIKLREMARARAEEAKKQAEIIRKRADRPAVEARPGKRSEGAVVRIEISGIDLKPEQMKDLAEKIEKLIPGKDRKVFITRGGDGPQPFKVVVPRMLEGGKKIDLEVVRPAPVRTKNAPRPEADRRIDNLEKKLDSVLRELESLRKEMRGPARRGGEGRGFGTDGGERGIRFTDKQSRENRSPIPSAPNPPKKPDRPAEPADTFFNRF